MNDRLYSMTVEEITEKFSTNAELGLSAKEADRRRRKGECGSIYKSVYSSSLTNMGRIAADITILIFALAAFVTAFFDSGKGTVVSLVITLLAYVFSMLAYAVSRRYSESLSEMSIPRARVIRGGKIMLVQPGDIVNGDLLIFEKGDVLPCDCRLVSSTELKAVEFIGRIGGKEKKALTTKDANFSCEKEDKINISEQKNMISASAVVISGKGKGIAVRTGRRTFISLMLGEIDAIPKSKNEPSVLAGISGILSKCCLALLISSVPITVVSMLLGRGSVGALDTLLCMLALAVTGTSEFIASHMSVFVSAAQYSSDKRINGAKIKNAAAIQELNYLDSVLILGGDSVCCHDRTVESVYASNRFFDENMGQVSDPSLNCLMDLALLGTAHYYGVSDLEADKNTVHKKLRAKAVCEFADKCGIDRGKLLSAYESVEFIGGEKGGFDTALIRKDDEYRVICVSDSSELLGLCTHIRTPDGAEALGIDMRSDILRACTNLGKKAKDVMLVASRISPCSSLSRLGAVQNQLIFEGYITFNAPFIESCAERIEEMNEADISVFFAAPESAESVITAFNIGAVKSRHDIAYASSFMKHGKKISDGFGQYKAYLGFTQKEIEELADLIRGEDGTLAVIASSSDDMSIMKRANVSAAIIENGNEEDVVGHYPEILRKNADVLLPFPSKNGGGFEAFCASVADSKSCISGIGKFLKYLAFSFSLRTVITILSLLMGNIALFAVHLAFLGVLIDIPVAFCFAFSKNTVSFSDPIEDIETIVTSPLKRLAKYMIIGGVLGVLTVMLASVFRTAGDNGSNLTVFSLVSASLLQIFASYIILGNKNGGLYGKRFSVIHGAVIMLLILLAITVPYMGALLNVTYSGWQACVAAPLVSIIGYVMILVTDRYT